MASATARSTRAVQQVAADPREPLGVLLADLGSSPDGLSGREAARRLIAYGPNTLVRRGGRRWPGELARQFTHPLALLLALAAVLAGVTGTPNLAAAIGGVILLNAVFAFVQEMQAERAVEALAAFLPERARVVRDGKPQEIPAEQLVPGDLLLLDEGEQVCADARLCTGNLEVDLSALTGESVPVYRAADLEDTAGPLIYSRDLVFSGTVCTAGQARAVVTATGMATELGRVAALSQRVKHDQSPLERQVKRVAWLIAAVGFGVAVAFLPLGLLAGLSLAAAVSFAIGLLVANVPEGLLPTITLALAVGVRDLARRGAVVKRLSAVETLGSTTVICTDKTGTLTQNRMTVTGIWTADADGEFRPLTAVGDLPDTRTMLSAAALCTTAVPEGGPDLPALGDPTELALMEAAAAAGTVVDPGERDARRAVLYHFDPRLKLMTTVDHVPGLLSDPLSEPRNTARTPADADHRAAGSAGDAVPSAATAPHPGAGLWVAHTKGAPEVVLGRCREVLDAGVRRALTSEARAALARIVERQARSGLRVLAVADRPGRPGEPLPRAREAVEDGLCLLGFVAMLDPPRPHVATAIERAHAAGVRVHVVTGDNGSTAAEIAHRVGIGGERPRVVSDGALEQMSEARLDELLSSPRELVFARSAPEAKLRIADALRDLGQVVAMTGDGVNDAPALRRADIGIAMGRSGTEVARQAATMVLTDDDFASIVAAIEAGRRAYDNVRKFITYIFAHLLPELVPFVVFALCGGAVPLPLTVMQILAIDLGTDTLPALALSREPAEPGVMDRPPRKRTEGVIDKALLARAWGFLGVIAASLVMAAYFLTLLHAGWRPGAAVGEGAPLHHAYQQAMTTAWLSIVACQIGAAFAVRTDHASLRTVGVLSNRPLLAGIGVSLAFAAALIYLPLLQPIFGTAALGPLQLAIVAPFPFLVWGADELRRARRRRRAR